MFALKRINVAPYPLSYPRAGEGKGYRLQNGYSGMKPHGRPSGSAIVLLLALLIIPCSVSGATPPQFPHIAVSVSNDTLSPDKDLVIVATWNRDASIYRSPMSVAVRLYNIDSGSLVAGYMVSESERASSDENVRHFRSVIPASTLPAGRLMLVVADPVSGADARALVNVTEPGPDYPGVRVQGDDDTVFFLAAAFLLVVLGTGLGLLIRRQ